MRPHVFNINKVWQENVTLNAKKFAPGVYKKGGTEYI